MRIEKVNGIILNERSYKESSKILDIMTKEFGIIGVIAKGSKSMKSKLRSFTTKLTYAEFQISYKEGKLSTLIDATIIDPLLEIRKDLLKISYSSFMLDLTSQVLKENDNKKIYDLLISSLLKINEGYDPEVICHILELKYLSYLGISPNFEGCSICNIQKAITLSAKAGGFVCKEHHTNEKIVDVKTLKIIRMLYLCDIDKITKIEVSDKIKKEIDEFIDEYYDVYTGLYIKSKEFLNKIKYSYI